MSFSGDANTPFDRATQSLTLALGFVWLTDMMLVFFVNSVFAGTAGFCDAESSEKNSSFTFLLVLQVALMLPVMFYFHEASLYDYAERQEEFGTSKPVTLMGAFLSYLASQLIILYIMANVFLLGPEPHIETLAPTPAPPPALLFIGGGRSVTAPPVPPRRTYMSNAWQNLLLFVSTMLFFATLVLVIRFKRTKY